MKKPLPFTFIVVAVFCSFIQMGCDRDNPASMPRNSQPVIEEIADIVVDAGAETTVEVNVTDADADDTHTITATCEDPDIAMASAEDETITISARDGGETTCTVYVTDSSGQNNAQSEKISFRIAAAFADEYTPVDWIQVTDDGAIAVTVEETIYGIQWNPDGKWLSPFWAPIQD